MYGFVVLKKQKSYPEMYYFSCFYRNEEHFADGTVVGPPMSPWSHPGQKRRGEPDRPAFTHTREATECEAFAAGSAKRLMKPQASIPQPCRAALVTALFQGGVTHRDTPAITGQTHHIPVSPLSCHRIT
ncbi:unnamed protein product [Lota lota]